ncbi:hypothetical protein QE152_g8962 [Popillia japonica]|uniref:Uncharacterized protein n=1 Tax=Popillia japonica TaxID=7064 RepID=A0AAW1LWL5_POPJA
MSRDDYSYEVIKKRKAELEDAYSVFERSYKTATKQMKEEDKFNQIKDQDKELSQSQRGIKEEILQLIEEQKQYKENIEMLERRENADLKRDY